MATYLVLNTIFLLVVGVVAYRKRAIYSAKSVIVALILMLSLTAVFDNLIIHAGIVAYDTLRISGIYIIKAPLEDFAYTVAAVLIVPLLWHAFGPQK